MKAVLKLVVLSSVLLTTSLSADMAWTEATASAEWQARCLAATVVFDGKMWVIGGDSATFVGAQNLTMMNDVWYTTDGDTWMAATDSAEWTGRASTALVFGDSMWILGGVSNSRLRNDVWCSANGAQWLLATDSAEWDRRFANAAVVFDGMMWVMGGCDSFTWSGPKSVRNDVWYSTDGAHWTQKTAAADWSPRCMPAALAFHDTMWILGGLDASQPFNDVWCSTDGAHWTQKTASAGWNGRMLQSALVFGDKMWVLGGYNGASNNDVWYSSDGINWFQAMLHAPWDARSGAAAADFKGNMWILGGADASRTMNDVWHSPGLEGVAENRTSPRPGSVGLSVQPNPFHNETRLAYSPTGACRVKVSIQDMSGRQIRLLVNDIPQPGPHSVTWDGCDRAGKNAPAGVYFALLSAGGHTVEKELVKLE